MLSFSGAAHRRHARTSKVDQYVVKMAANGSQGDSSFWGLSRVPTLLWKGAKTASSPEVNPTFYEDHKELIIVSQTLSIIVVRY